MFTIIDTLDWYKFDLKNPPKARHDELGLLFHEVGHAIDLIVNNKHHKVLQECFGFKTLGILDEYPEWLIKSEARACAYAIICEANFTSGIMYYLGSINTKRFERIFFPKSTKRFHKLVWEYKQELEPSFYPALRTLKRIVRLHRKFNRENEWYT